VADARRALLCRRQSIPATATASLVITASRTRPGREAKGKAFQQIGRRQKTSNLSRIKKQAHQGGPEITAFADYR
jgi:hypothetical protein